MSQFNFPRINFHGSVLLDVATANNGKFDPLRVYNQEEAAPYLPPRVYLTSDQAAYVKANFTYQVLPLNSQGPFYVEISPINNADIFTEWATYSLGTYPLDQSYKPLYDYIPLTGSDPAVPLSSNWITPGYWNYFGDLSVYAEDVRITGVQLPDNSGGVSTWTPNDSQGCPAVLAEMLGSNLSFHQNFFDPNSRTTAMFCDVDSEGQTCTQMFMGNAGVYSNLNGVQKTFFSGKPCKSTFNWMSLSKVLNWSDANNLLAPMNGSCYFYSTINLANCDPSLQSLLNQYAGQPVTALFMKILVHEVYEVHNPDYTKMPKAPIGNNQTEVPKNPARVAFSGSICPWIPGDMKTNSICRILKNPPSVNLSIDQSKMTFPTPLGATGPVQPSTPFQIQLPPAFLLHNPSLNLISMDLINTISEYGIGFGELANFGGPTAIPPFLSFESYDFGQMSLYFQEDGNQFPPQLIGNFDHTNDYNMQRFLASGGMVDFSVSPNSNFSQGKFYISLNNQKILAEDDYLILSDQQGSYAEQTQIQSYGYMSDGLPRGPVYIRAFYRGQPIQQCQNLQCTVQQIQMYVGNIISEYSNPLYDGMSFQYSVDQPGCLVYSFAVTPDQKLGSNGLYFLTNGYFITSRVLASYPDLVPYLNGSQPITWRVVFDNVFANFHTVLPIMNAIIPFQESNWSEPLVLRRLIQFTDESAWGDFMYMPVTRELSAQQRELLQLWANQTLNSLSSKTTKK